jgi:hypothetical protein
MRTRLPRQLLLISDKAKLLDDYGIHTGIALLNCFEGTFVWTILPIAQERYSHGIAELVIFQDEKKVIGWVRPFYHPQQ